MTDIGPDAVRTYTVQFQAPPQAGLYTFQAIVKSDSYLGSDATRHVKLKVDDPSALNADDVEDEISDPEEDRYVCASDSCWSLIARWVIPLTLCSHWIQSTVWRVRWRPCAVARSSPHGARRMRRRATMRAERRRVRRNQKAILTRTVILIEPSSLLRCELWLLVCFTYYLLQHDNCNKIVVVWITYHVGRRAVLGQNDCGIWLVMLR